MQASNIKQIAQAIIGKNQENDYILDPSSHVEEYAVKAPELSEILQSSAVRALAREYKKRDSQAVQAQSEFKKWSNRANRFVFATACFTAGLLATMTLSEIFIFSNYSRYLLMIFAFGAVSSGTFAGISINRIRAGSLLKKWMRERAEAETLRIEYFNAVVHFQTLSKTLSAVPLALLQLEYFRRYQLDVQLAFYDVRGKQHAILANRTLSQNTWTMGSAALVNGLAGVFGWFGEHQLVAIAGVALILNAFASKTTNTEAVNQDMRNAERYERTRSVLAILSGKLDSVRKGILEGKRDIFINYVQAIHEQLSLEHRQWLDASDERLSVIGRLEQQLREHDNKQG